jgi:hypothetical protein
MKENAQPSSEFQRFDETVRKMISVPREELEKREKEWKRKRARVKKKRAT